MQCIAMMMMVMVMMTMMMMMMMMMTVVVAIGSNWTAAAHCQLQLLHAAAHSLIIVSRCSRLDVWRYTG
jgi:hypothetical protein